MDSPWLGTPSKMPRRVRPTRSRLLIVVVILIGGLFAKLVLKTGVYMMVISTVEMVRQLGAWGFPLIIGVEMLAFLVCMPISPIHVGVGFLYGPRLGLLLGWVAYMVGCLPPFLLARVPFLSDRFAALRRRTNVLDGVFSAVEQDPFKLIVCLRLSPVIPSTLNSYLLGLTSVRLHMYVLGSGVGALPNVAAYVYLGSVLESLSDLAAGRVQKTPATWALLVVGCATTIGLLVWVSRAAQRRLERPRADDDSPSKMFTDPAVDSVLLPSTPMEKQRCRSSTPDGEYFIEYDDPKEQVAWPLSH